MNVAEIILGIIRGLVGPLSAALRDDPNVDTTQTRELLAEIVEELRRYEAHEDHLEDDES